MRPRNICHAERRCMYITGITGGAIMHSFGSFVSKSAKIGIKTHDSESRGQEEAAVRDE